MWNTPPDVIVAAARGAGVAFCLAAEGDLFTLESGGPLDPLISDAIRANYDAILDALRRERDQGASAGAPPRGNSGKPQYEVIGPAPAGERCTLCGSGSPRPMRIKHGGETDIWHQECADRYVAAVADPPQSAIDQQVGEETDDG